MNTNGKKSPLKECIQFIEECKKEGMKGDTPFSEGEEAESFDIKPDARNIRYAQYGSDDYHFS